MDPPEHSSRVVQIAAGVFALIWACVWIANLIVLTFALWHFKVRKRRYKSSQLHPEEGVRLLPGVSVLKPLVGVDDHLRSNLETFFGMTYPGPYELLFCVTNESDPAFKLCQDLMSRYPKVDARIFVGAADVGRNAKVNNMFQAYEAAKYDLVMTSDAGIRMEEDTLADSVSIMEEEDGFVQLTPFVCDRKGFPSLVEQVFFGTNYARMFLLGQLLDPTSCTNGMAMIFRKSVLDRLGGIKSLGNNLVEDVALGKAFGAAGYKARLAYHPARQNPAPSSNIEPFKDRLYRWLQLEVSNISKWALLGQVLIDRLASGIYASWALDLLLNCDPLATYILNFLFWLLFQYMLLKIINGKPISSSAWEFTLASLVQELISYQQVFLILCHPDPSIVRWRKNNYKILPGGVIESAWPAYVEAPGRDA